MIIIILGICICRHLLDIISWKIKYYTKMKRKHFRTDYPYMSKKGGFLCTWAIFFQCSGVWTKPRGAGGVFTSRGHLRPSACETSVGWSVEQDSFIASSSYQEHHLCRRQVASPNLKHFNQQRVLRGEYTSIKLHE